MAGRPVAYRILYRVEAQVAPPFTTRWEELTVRRPFESRQVTYADRPARPLSPGGSGTLATVDHLFLIGPDRGPNGIQEVSGRQPGSPTGDQALAPTLAEAVARDLARPGARRVVAGRVCHDAAFLEPVAGPIKALRGSDRDLICIDGQGLVLREEWTLGGRVVQRKEAVEVSLDPGDLDAAFSSAGASPAPGSAAPAVTPRPPADPAFPDPPAPPGFRLATTVGFSLPAPQQLGSGPPALLYSSTVWAFARGADSITVEEGTSVEDALPWSDRDPSRAVSLSGRRGTTVLRNDGPEVRVALEGRRWLRVRGTVRLSELVAYARGLLVR